MLKVLQWILGAIVTLSLIYIAALNPQSTDLNWNKLTDTPLAIPIYVIILVSFISGYLIGIFYYWLGDLPKRFKSYKKQRELEKTIDKLEKELEQSNDYLNPENLLRD